MSETTNVKECDFCTKTLDESIRVDFSDSSEVYEFCDWPCVATFALKRLSEMKDSANTTIADLKAKIEELDYLLTQLRGQAGV